MIARTSRRTRASLLLSAAGICLSLAAPVHAAEDDDDHRVVLNDPAATIGAAGGVGLNRDHAELAPHDGTIRINPAEADVEPQIVVGSPQTPVTSRDPVNITGVGQMFINNGGGSVGLCTGTLINPRTVLFAAHCVNSRAATAYGANSGGTPISFGFETNTRANAAGQPDELLLWYQGARAGQTNVAQSLYNANAVAYHPGSLEPAAGTFRYSDIAIASLDTPAEGIPTWALLFSPLAGPAQNTANGTGYHVNITGYGNTGTGTSGATGSDFRRRVAENMLGALASLNDFETFLFGSGSGLPQNLYWIDFDDPRRGTAAADPRDFNAWRDNPTPNEGITSQGDSGGPLILDRSFSRQLVIGVLSGGYTRFFNGAPANGYGTASFYQPLYLYWDWIAANNPYRYVGNVAGNRNWNDASNWVTLNDPNYFIIGPDGQVVNGVPANPGEGKNGTSGKFGQACFEGPVAGGLSECQDMATGQVTTTVRPIGTDAVGGGLTVSIDQVTGEIVDTAGTANLGAFEQVVRREEATLESQGTVTGNALPPATIANGLPGATNFVPNNSNGNRTEGVLPRYFDVTLSAAGTTTLDTAVTIDKFTLNGVQAGLTITSSGSLTSLMDVTQIIGTMHVDGALNAPSDFFIMAGGLSGNGVITSPYTTSMAGVIAPGNANTIGTLTFRGNLILASGTAYLVNLGNNGQSDRIAVTSNGANSGTANIGGQLVLSFTNALRANDTYTILTAQGGITGTFANLASISAILTPRLTYTANAVQLQVQAGNYTSVVSPTSPVAYSYAQILDANRGQANRWDGLYGPLDLQSAATITATLNGLAPYAQTTGQSLGIASLDTTSGFIRSRMASLDTSNLGGTLTSYGQPVRLASLNMSGMNFGPEVRSDAAPMMVQEAVLPETVSAFIAGGYLNGDAAPLMGATGRDDFDGWYVAGGIETQIGDNGAVGFAISYTRTDATGAVAGQEAQGDLYAGTLYSKSGRKGGLVLDSQLTFGKFDVSTQRTVSFLGTGYTLRAQDRALAIAGEVGLGAELDLGGFEVTPRAAGRVTQIGFSQTAERGGPMALSYDRGDATSIQGRAGVTVAGTSSSFRPWANATYVHDFDPRNGAFAATLVGGVGGGVFALNNADTDYGEVSGGLTVRTGNLDLSISAETSIGRSDLSVQAYRGSLSFRF